jgi:hypothetical protein
VETNFDSPISAQQADIGFFHGFLPPNTRNLMNSLADSALGRKNSLLDAEDRHSGRPHNRTAMLTHLEFLNVLV